MPSKAVIAGAAAASAAAVAALLYFLLKQDKASATGSVPVPASGSDKPSAAAATSGSGVATASEPVGAASAVSTTAAAPSGTTTGDIPAVNGSSPETTELFEKSKAAVERALNGAELPTATPEELQALLAMSPEEQAEVAAMSSTRAASLRKITTITAELVVITRKFTAALKARMDAGELSAAEAGPALAAFMQIMDVQVPASHGLAPSDVQAIQAEHESTSIMQRLVGEMRKEIADGFGVVAGNDHWSVERFVDLIKQMSIMTVHHMEQVKQDVLASGLRGEAAMQQFQMRFMLSAEQHQADLLDDLGVSQEQFQANLMAHMNNPAVQEALQGTAPELEARQRACMTEW